MKWEYKVENTLTEIELDDLGSQGWELVTVVKVDEHTYSFWFKRLMAVNSNTEYNHTKSV